MGKCIDNCSNGFYEDEIDSSIKKCKCEEEIKCKECSLESLSHNNLCISCNDNYYPILNEENNFDKFINCYTGNKEGYYLDIIDEYYKPCYFTCKTCNDSGNESFHNCLTCHPDYEMIENLNGDKNCYQKCNNYFYFDNEGNYICLDVNECPDNFNKLIFEKNQCIDQCNKHFYYNYEFQNKCYHECPKNISYISSDKNNFCEIICTKDKPFEIKEEQICTDFCGINDMNNNLCVSKYKDEDSNANLILNNIHQDIITTNFNKHNLYNNNLDIIINEVYTTFTITTYKIHKSLSKRIVNLDICENFIKFHYTLTNTDKLIILIINVKKDDTVDKIVYEVYGDLNNDNKLIKLDLDNCYDDLLNNEFMKCSIFSIESILDDLCISCSNSFAPKYNDPLNKNNFTQCYKEPKGCYLDIEDNLYKECYHSCETCDEKGNDINHNCLTCNINYNYELNMMNNHINCYNECQFYFYYNSTNDKYYCTSERNCPYFFNKLISEKNQCIESCMNDSEYQYEFRNSCHIECPPNISELSEEKNFFCEAICPKEYPFKIVETQNCVKSCTIFQRQKEICINNYNSKENEEGEEIEEKSIENIKEELTTDFDPSILDKGEIIMIKQKDSTIIMRSIDDLNNEEEKLQNISKIYLGQCETKIKDEYKISKNNSLYLLQLEIKQDGFQIPKIDYEVYYPLLGGSLIRLNLTACENTKIDISIPVTLNDDIDKINASSGFYNDICYTYTSPNGTDVPLSLRKEEFVKNNLTVCEEDCEFIDYDYLYRRAICSCNVKTNSSFKIRGTVIEKERLLKSFTNINNIANIKVLECIKLIFNLDAYKNNYANLILIGILLLYFITLIIFCFKDYPYLKKIIDMIIFFKLNAKLIKKLLAKKNKTEQLKNEITPRILTTTKNNCSNKGKVKKKTKKYNENNKSHKVFIINYSHYHIPKPIFHKLMKNKNKSNPIKRKKVNSKNIINNINIIPGTNVQLNENKINSVKSKRKLIHKKIEENININGLNEEDIYQNYLKINKKTDIEINSLLYKESIIYDKRTYFSYYLSLIRSNHILFFSFLPNLDYNSQILKIFIFFFDFTTNFLVNALFFNDTLMAKIYADGGSFDFIYNILKFYIHLLHLDLLTP